MIGMGCSISSPLPCEMAKVEEKRSMRIIVWGLGYVGTVSAACLAQLGHEVIGVEPNLTKVEALNAGHSAIKEPSLDHLVSQMVGMGRLRATQDGVSLLPCADMSLICVGTPA